VDALWRAIVDTRIIVVLGALLLAQTLASIVLPQMPGQLQNEPLAASRWLTAMADEFGAVGALLSALGLFDVLHSPVFLITLWAAIFVLLVHVADSVQFAMRFRRLPELLDQAIASGGEALPVVMSQRVWRWRGAVPRSSLAVIAAIEASVKAWATRVERRVVRASAPPQRNAEADEAADGSSTILEERLLGLRGWSESLVRPLLPIGMILALVVVVWYAGAGHSFAPPPLLPGERASDTTLGLAVEYVLTYPEPGVVGPVLRVTQDELQRSLPLEAGSIVLDGATVNARPGAPALLVHTLDNTALLARPGQTTPAASITLGFPNPGSEQVLVLPEHAIGMRMIRQDDGAPSARDDAFVVEVFQGDGEEATQRFVVNGSQVKPIETANGAIPIGFVPLAMFQVHAYTTPGIWLIAPAALLVLAGIFGFRRKPAFLLVQAGPWPVERSVVILQGDQPAAVDELRNTIETSGLQSGQSQSTEGA
jgi:hypothetical protein